LTQNNLNKLKYGEVDLEEFKKEKLALEEKIVKDDCVENLQRLAQVIGVNAQHSKEIKKLEDWLSEKSTWPLKFKKVSDVSSVKLKAILSFFSVGGKGMVSIGFLSLPSVSVGVEAVRLVEPVVEEAKVNKQMSADAGRDWNFVVSLHFA
jgi:hypothetical protein